ncbi:MAG TPA: hypothetical protein VM285_11810 [Polyangia bacterium]|nr:hypothetical protein [Polyangia bacterium]
MRLALKALLVLVPLSLLLGGCLAVGQAFNLAQIVATLVAAGGGAIAVAALDKREWIRSKAKQPFFAGTLRGGFGNPFDVVVGGRVPLSDAFGQVIAASLKAKGFQPQVVITTVDDTDDQARQKLAATGAGRSLLISIDKWQSDTMTNVAMHYLLTATVFDVGGNQLASHTITGAENGKDNLRGSVMNPAGYAKKAVPKAFQDQIERLLNHDDIAKALG